GADVGAHLLAVGGDLDGGDFEVEARPGREVALADAEAGLEEAAQARLRADVRVHEHAASAVSDVLELERRNEVLELPRRGEGSRDPPGERARLRERLVVELGQPRGDRVASAQEVVERGRRAELPLP